MSYTEILTIPKDMLTFHDHPLTCTDAVLALCPLCDTEKRGSSIVYHCPECDFSLHKDCVKSFLNYPFHYNHFLKIIKPSPLDSTIHHCHFCQVDLSSLFARCTICNISMDLSCMKIPPPHTIFEPKHHKHSLTLLSREVTFTCNACGVKGDRDPYVCYECNLMLHKDCIDLPRVININRHDHRVSHTFHLGQAYLECGVCRKTIDWLYGAFICSRCPSYAVHSKCASRKEVWDGIELEDVPEEEEEIDDPFEVINETDIIHFSHKEHTLRLDENFVKGNAYLRCRACFLAINGDPCYKCVDCDFSLHRACVSLPRKQRLILHNHKVILQVVKDEAFLFPCIACENFSNGFRYECLSEDHCEDVPINYDVRCGSISEPFHHDLHPHPLYLTLEGPKRCRACHTDISEPLRCTVCEYALCMKCATLPRKVKHRYDDHFLSLGQGLENASGDLWCDICETKTDPSVRYYACDECGVSLHVNCVLGDLGYMMVGNLDSEIEVLPNNGATRPLCSICEVRCKFPFLMKLTTEEDVRYICSVACVRKIDE